MCVSVGVCECVGGGMCVLCVCGCVWVDLRVRACV